MKKLLTKLLSILMVISCIAFNTGVSVYADSTQISGTGVYWEIDNSTLKITGSGVIPDYGSSSDTPWDANSTQINTIIINDGITAIGTNAFFNFINLTCVTIGKDVTSIGENAFKDCSNLTTVTFEEGSELLTIGRNSFNGCSKLASIIIPDKVTKIDEYAFYECTSLSDLTIGKCVEYIEECAFSEADITTLVIPDSVTKIGYWAFSYCQKLNSVTFKSQDPPAIADTDNSSYAENAFDNVSDTGVFYVPAGTIGDSNSGYTKALTDKGVTLDETHWTITEAPSAPSTVSTAYVNAAGEAQTNKDCTPITDSTTSLGTSGTESWYVANDDVEVTANPLTVNGNVNLILVDGKTLNVANGITLSDSSSSLTIYGQSAQTGTLNTKTIFGNGGSAPIGTFTVNGGVINTNSDDFGIATNYVYINAGKVYADGNIATIYGYSNVGISGGTVEANSTSSNGIYSSADISISGGNVTVNVSGNSEYYVNGIYAENSVNITGGTVTVSATNNADKAYGIFASRSGIVINGGNVTASASGVAIDGPNVEIKGGTTKANGSKYAIYSNDSSLTIDTSKLSITGANYRNTPSGDSTDTYVSGKTHILTNILGTGYVTISPSTPTTPTGGSNATGGSENTYKVPNTGVEGVNPNNSISKVIGLISLVTLAGYVVIKKKED